ncbi:hypothetical protein HMI01_15260 [Halolactibacillus miurensis]|uniref:Uncharacterized protein n=1 Tax=Halolactibacillus miurensis TaxID=306541 RepID=A0A1I6RYQ3_9BACI|nr:hypothetical protein [Halolactibacillus miurensis]GEM04538.1 hypothetical protein HMI01_15260 [Halolactibacillus miurensis]SFS69839.1 hypothetical protein SAMN05421668_10737 [Halolactibacillus miurensis]
MIRIIIDHSYEDDYFRISHLDIDLKDKEKEKEVRERFKKIEQSLVIPGRFLTKRIAKALDVDENLIELDTEEIDIN